MADRESLKRCPDPRWYAALKDAHRFLLICDISVRGGERIIKRMEDY